jgi:hypothetical protein
MFVSYASNLGIFASCCIAAMHMGYACLIKLITFNSSQTISLIMRDGEGFSPRKQINRGTCRQTQDFYAGWGRVFPKKTD